MNLIFSLASYGLSVYEWYLMGGLLLVMRRFAVTPRGNVAQGATM